MSASMASVSFPLKNNVIPVACRDSKVCVVSVIGKSRYNVFTSKASMLNPILDADIFKGVAEIKEKADQGEIECYYDSDSSVVYLHHASPLDTYRLTAVCQKLKDSLHKDFRSLWQQEEYHCARTLLLLFSVSHIIVVSNPGSSFDITFIRLFRTLDAIRLKAQKCISEQLMGFHISKDWILGARPCSPRVLFVFEKATFDYTPEEGEGSGYSRSRSQRQSPIKRLQHAMEDQIYKLLRKSRVITNISNNSLFAVPANQEFVYIHCVQNEAADPVGLYLQQLRNNSTTRDTDSPKGRSYQTNRRTHAGPTEGSRSSTMLSRNGGENSFKEFLWQHIELALTKGFDDNVGRHQVSATFELATSETWFAIASKLYEFFFAEKLDPKIQPHFNTLKSLLETDVRFSENRCNKVLPMAESSYQENLPSHYVTNYHLSKIAQAKRVFSQFARGPACDKYLKQLEDSCEKFWKNGRQLCEEISLTGNHCVSPLHRLPDTFETEENAHLPIMQHSSQLKMKAACNCGRKQADKDDPFDHKAANFDFYDTFEKTCCGKLQHIAFPIFQPSTTDIRAATLTTSPRGRTHSHTKLTPKDSTSVKGDIMSGMASLSLALSLGQSEGGSDLYGHGGQSSPLPDQDSVPNQDHTEANTPTSPVSPCPTRQHSTTEYLPGMIHSESPLGHLPKFPSWSLVCLGKSALYSHTQGIDLPGFLSGSNFLLPWEVTVRAEKDKWPSVGETVSKKGKQKRSTREFSEVNLKIYLGEEYECPRGHRFFCSGPEKIIKVSSTSTVKDNASKLLNMDMPLYCPCHCRSSKGYMAQLMRIYVVTPEGPTRVTLNPMIQPAPHPCPVFHPGMDEAIELPPGGLWVLRLPAVYMGDHGAYTMPSDPSHLPACRLLKGVFSYKDSTVES